MSIELEGINLFLLVFVRLCGMIFLNPLFSRRNIPGMARMGLISFLTVLIVPTLDSALTAGMGDISLMVAMIRELAIGAVMGYVFQIFYYMLFFVGDYLDTAFGMSMAKIFDPGTNLQMSITSNVLSILFMLYIFAGDSHLAMIHLFVSSFQMLPPAGALFTPELAHSVLLLFTEVFMLVVRLIMPFALAEFSLEVSMGILMKIVPQIHIFVINFQFKQGLGLLMLILFAPFVGSFIDHYIVVLLDQMQQALLSMGGTLPGS